MSVLHHLPYHRLSSSTGEASVLVLSFFLCFMRVMCVSAIAEKSMPKLGSAQVGGRKGMYLWLGLGKLSHLTSSGAKRTE